jgi:hypothetical protein
VIARSNGRFFTLRNGRQALLVPAPHLTPLPPRPSWSMRLPTSGHDDFVATREQAVMMDAGLAAAPAAWRTCEIVLVARRMGGATPEFFADWRFEAVMRRRAPESETALAAVAIPPCRQTAAAPAARRRETFAWTWPTPANLDIATKGAPHGAV